MEQSGHLTNSSRKNSQRQEKGRRIFAKKGDPKLTEKLFSKRHSLQLYPYLNLVKQELGKNRKRESSHFGKNLGSSKKLLETLKRKTELG